MRGVCKLVFKPKKLKLQNTNRKKHDERYTNLEVQRKKIPGNLTQLADVIVKIHILL